MADNQRRATPEATGADLAEYLSLEPDAATVHQVEQRLELRITGTTAYMPSYTRRAMNKTHGAPITAFFTKTDKLNKRVYLYAADDPKDRQAVRLRSAESLGPAFFAFGVPLRSLGLKFPVSRRVILPLTPLEVPDQGTVWWASFAEIEQEARTLKAAVAAISWPST